MSLAALLIASLSLIASVSLIIVFCVLWLRSPVDMERDQTSQTQPPDKVTTEDAKTDQAPTSQTPPTDNLTSEKRADQKPPQAKSKAESDGVFRVGEEGVRAPSIAYRVEPTYSEEARKAKLAGIVVLSAVVRKDGTIEILKVARGLGLGLDENAITALRQWKFRPGTKDGVPVDVALNIEVNFSLRK